ncbi:MAG: flagellar basal body P-ring formation chaperone FlgA [Caulobacteraceae bacterium]
MKRTHISAQPGESRNPDRKHRLPFRWAPAFAGVSGIGVALAVFGSALAGEVSLRADVALSNGRVTLGDIFDGAGAASRVVVATGTGASVVLDAGRVQSLASANGLTWANEQGVRRIIARAGASPSVSRASASPAGVNRSILAYARNIATGEIVQPEDLVWAKAAAAPADAPRDAGAVIGKAAKRPLREGAASSMRDVSAPAVIKKDEIISVAFAVDGIRLVLQAKAMSAAAQGETFTAMNPGSKKIIQVVATGPSEAVVGPEAQAARSTQFASLR